MCVCVNEEEMGDIMQVETAKKKKKKEIQEYKEEKTMKKKRDPIT